MWYCFDESKSLDAFIKGDTVAVMKTNTNNMTEGNLRKQILEFAFPLFIGYLFQQLYSTVDSLIVGNLLGADALASVTSTGSVTYLLVGFFTGFSSGSSIVIARAIGGGNRKDTSDAVHTAVATGLICSVAATIAGVAGTPYLLKMMGTPDNVIGNSVLYLRIIFAGVSATILYNTFTGILQAGGDSKDPLHYLMISSCINVVLDLTLIGVFHMGVDGAAYATIFSQFVSMLLALHKLVTINDSIRLTLTKISVHRRHLTQIIRYGLPTAMQACVTDIANIMIQSYVNSFGSAAMAGIGAYSRIEGFGFLPITAFSLSMSTFISQNMGAKNYDRVKEGIRFGLTIGLICAECIGLCFFIFAPQLISMFVRDADVIAYGVSKARISGFFYFLLAFSHLVSAVMRGLGKPMAPMVVMLVCWCAVRVVIFSTVGRIFHYIQLTYWVYPFTWFLSSTAFILYAFHIYRNGIFNPERKENA